MATQPRLVNKQFNSPIGLYSEQNIREVIERDSQILANGAVGINFHNPAVGKPSNLQNSAVMRMLEEEEMRQRNGHSPGNGYDYSKPLRDQIKWPPPEYEHKNLLKATFKDVVTPGLKRVAWPPPNEGEIFVDQSPTQPQPHQGGPQYTPQPQNNYASAPQAATNNLSSRHPLKPLDISSASSHSASPVANQSPIGFRPATPNRQWAPVTPPVVQQQPPYQIPSQSQYQPPQQQYQAPQQQYQPPQQQYQSPQQQYQPPQQQYQPPQQQYQSPQQQYQPPQQQYQTSPKYQPAPQTPQSQYNQQTSSQSVGVPNQVVQPRPAVKQVEPPPTTITLRKEAPVRQAPPPVVSSQPATATLKGGKHLRGDLKWPPEHVKKQFEEQYRQQIELSKGPACRPTLKKKDYTPFFAQHALNNAYPGYKVPPGTQFYEHNPRC